MGQREAAVESYLAERVNKIGGLCYKWVSPGHNGVPDRIVIFGGMVWFVEVKSPDGKLDHDQRRELDRLILQGMNTSIIYGRGAVDTFINGIQVAAAEQAALK